MNFDHIAISSKNVENSVSWYCENFSASVVYQDSTWAMLEIGDTKVAIVTEGQHPPHYAFRVESREDIPCDEKEIKVHRDGSSYLYMSDPDGNVIEWVAYASEEE